jgi:hypothetical protein
MNTHHSFEPQEKTARLLQALAVFHAAVAAGFYFLSLK